MVRLFSTNITKAASKPWHTGPEWVLIDLEEQTHTTGT
jgi:hypothetical protein